MFWKRALSRPTDKVFSSMKDELKKIAVFNSFCSNNGVPVWEERDYYFFWKFEEERVKLCKPTQSGM